MGDSLLKRAGLEIPRPGRQTIWGFVLAWAVVLAIVLVTMWLARLGA